MPGYSASNRICNVKPKIAFKLFLRFIEDWCFARLHGNLVYPPVPVYQQYSLKRVCLFHLKWLLLSISTVSPWLMAFVFALTPSWRQWINSWKLSGEYIYRCVYEPHFSILWTVIIIQLNKIFDRNKRNTTTSPHHCNASNLWPCFVVTSRNRQGASTARPTEFISTRGSISTARTSQSV